MLVVVLLLDDSRENEKLALIVVVLDKELSNDRLKEGEALLLILATYDTVCDMDGVGGNRNVTDSDWVTVVLFDLLRILLSVNEALAVLVSSPVRSCVNDGSDLVSVKESVPPAGVRVTRGVEVLESLSSIVAVREADRSFEREIVRVGDTR